MSAPVFPDEQVDVPIVHVPDRADAPISEITERFFRALLLHVPIDRIEELHLFSPLRQGGVETGIAVIAAREVIVPPPVPTLELTLDGAPADAASVDSVAPVVAPVVASLEGARDAEAVPEVDAASDVDVAPGIDTTFDMNAAPEVDEPSPYADEEPELAVVAEADADAPPAPTPIIRHTVFTARYRLVQKGPERGKWEADVVAEAEAPLITVETVVRGVQRRAGEDSETTRFSGAQIARALRMDVSTGQVMSALAATAPR